MMPWLIFACWVKPRLFASSLALVKSLPSSWGECASELMAMGMLADWANFRNSTVGYWWAQGLRQPAVLISRMLPVSAIAWMAGS